jgi:tetratricopeptide (TPR) repeat protein
VVKRWHAGAEARVGLAHSRLNQYKEAVAHLETALMLLDTHSSASALPPGEAAPASPLLSASASARSGGAAGAVDVHCTPVSLHLALAQVHHMNSAFALAQTHYSSALNCQPPPTLDDQLTTLYNLASLQLMAGRNGEAIGYLKQADLLRADSPMILNLWAQALLAQNQPEQGTTCRAAARSARPSASKPLLACSLLRDLTCGLCIVL